MGKPTWICEFCGAMLWYEERSQKSKRPRRPKFSICCMQGKVQLPLLKDPPQFLQNLLKAIILQQVNLLSKGRGNFDDHEDNKGEWNKGDTD